MVDVHFIGFTLYRCPLRRAQRGDVHGVRDDALRQHALVRRVGNESGADDLGTLLLQRLQLFDGGLLLQHTQGQVRRQLALVGRRTLTVGIYSGNLLRPSPAPKVTRHTSHVTRHTSHVTRHTSQINVTRHKSKERVASSVEGDAPFFGGLLGRQGLPDIVFADCTRSSSYKKAV